MGWRCLGWGGVMWCGMGDIVWRGVGWFLCGGRLVDVLLTGGVGVGRILGVV